MQFWQRATSVSVSEGNNEGVTACDRHGFEFGNASAGAATISRSTDTPTNLGFPYSFKIDVTTSNDASNAGTQIRMHHKIESQDIRNSGWKYNDPNSFLTISFYFKSNKSGTNKLPVNIVSANGTAYYYVSEITQSDTNWNRHTVKIPGNANLFFENNNSAGLQVYWYFAVGSTYHTTADTWGTTQKHGTSDSTNYFDSTSNEMFITGIQMEATTTGLATDFEHKIYADELLRCQRYYQISFSESQPGVIAGRGTGTSTVHCSVPLACSMRSSPSLSDSNFSQVYAYLYDSRPHNGSSGTVTTNSSQFNSTGAYLTINVGGFGGNIDDDRIVNIGGYASNNKLILNSEF
jgi:hypothetical protein